MEDACLVRLSAYDVLQLLVVTSTHRHSYFVDWIHVRCSSEGATSFPFSHSYNVARARWGIFSARAGPSCGVFFSFDVILEVISSFLSPGPLSYSAIPQSEQGASSMEDCLNLHRSNVGLQLGHWRVGRAFSHQGRLTTRCLLGCHFSAGFVAVPTVLPLEQETFVYLSDLIKIGQWTGRKYNLQVKSGVNPGNSYQCLDYNLRILCGL